MFLWSMIDFRQRNQSTLVEAAASAAHVDNVAGMLGPPLSWRYNGNFWQYTDSDVVLGPHGGM